MKEVWIGFVELRQLPVADPQIRLNGRGAFTWITCWAHDKASFLERAKAVENEYGLFVVDVEQAMSYSTADKQGFITDELVDQYERTSADENFCIFGTSHSYKHDN